MLIILKFPKSIVEHRGKNYMPTWATCSPQAMCKRPLVWYLLTLHKIIMKWGQQLRFSQETSSQICLEMCLQTVCCKKQAERKGFMTLALYSLWNVTSSLCIMQLLGQQMLHYWQTVGSTVCENISLHQPINAKNRVGLAIQHRFKPLAWHNLKRAC